MVAQQFIKNTVSIKPTVSQDIEDVDKQLSQMFPNAHIKARGIQQSVDSWIKRNYNVKNQSRIRDNTSIGGYDIIDRDRVHHISETTKPLENKELRKYVEEHLETLDDREYELQVDRAVDIIKNRYAGAGTTSLGRYFRNCGTFLETALKQYFTYTIVKKASGQDDIVYDWNLVQKDVLQANGILLFQYRNTKQ